MKIMFMGTPDLAKECLRQVYEKDGVTCMDIYVHADCVGKGNLYTDFSRDR